MRKFIPWTILIAVVAVVWGWLALMPGTPVELPPTSNSALAAWYFGPAQPDPNPNFFIVGVLVVLLVLPWLVVAAHLREIAVGGVTWVSARISLPLGLALAPLALHVGTRVDPDDTAAGWIVLFVYTACQLAVFLSGYIRAINAPRRVATA